MLSWLTNATRSVSRGFKQVYCNPQPLAERNLCHQIPIRVVSSWSIGAFAGRDAAGRYITITAGTAGMLDVLDMAQRMSLRATGGDACFKKFALTYARVTADNTARHRARQPLRPMPNLITVVQREPQACRGVTAMAIQRLPQSELNDHAGTVEAGLAFLLLHELGHHALNHPSIDARGLTLSQRRSMELAADSWAVRAATKANQHLLGGMTAFWLTLLQGGSIGWERASDHPLGVRRALNFYTLIKAEYQRNPTFRRPFERDATYDELMRDLNHDIALATNCLRRVEAGGGLGSCG